MRDQRWELVSTWFDRVVDLPRGARRAALDVGCNDAAVREEVLSLLAAEACAGERLEPSPGYRSALGGGLAPRGEEAGRVLGAYRLETPLGRGGMGSVWLARRTDDEFRKQVAIKLVKRGLDTDELLARFRRERQVLADLEHPHIARLIDGAAAPDGRPYMVLEYVEGTPIDEWCEAQQLDLDARLELFCLVCDAVQYAHQNLVVHRDLKPSNVLVARDGTPKLLDFGIAKLLDPGERSLTEELTTASGFMTPEYASPEQVRAERITTASDVYSLGVLLFRLSTGVAPYRFETRSRQELERVVCELTAPRASSVVKEPRLRRALTGDLDRILSKALRKEPERRYASVERFAEDVRRHLDGYPVLAQPDSVRYRTTKFVRRNLVVVLASTAILGVLLAALVVITALLGEARGERAVAERRSGQLRDLTSELIFELHDEIAQLPGATAARHRLVDTGTRYLAVLAEEAADDPELLEELSEGYTRLADVQGRPTAASLGDTAGALANHRRALGLLDELLVQRPDDPRLLRSRALAEQSIGALLLRMGETSEALETFERGLAGVDASESEGHAAKLLYHRAEALVALGRTGEALEAAGECLDTTRHWAAAHPEDRAARRMLHLILFKLADLHSAERDFARAEAEALEALAITEELLSDEREDAQAERDLGLMLAMLARIRIDSGRAHEAEEATARQLALFEALAEADAANPLAQLDLSLAYERNGSLLLATADTESALDSFQRSVELAEEVSATDPENLEWSYALAVAHDKLCGAALALGRLEQAFASAERMVELLLPIVAADPADARARRTLAMGSLRLGQLHLEAGDFAASLEAFERAQGAFALLAEEDPDNAWTRRLAMVTVYFVGWAHRELGRDPALPHEERAVHLESALRDLERSTLLHEELDGLGMLQPEDADQLVATRAEIEACAHELERLAATPRPRADSER